MVITQTAEEVHGRLFVTRGYQGPLQYYSGLGGGDFYDGNSASTSTHGVNGAMTSSIAYHHQNLPLGKCSITMDTTNMFI